MKWCFVCGYFSILNHSPLWPHWIYMYILHYYYTGTINVSFYSFTHTFISSFKQKKMTSRSNNSSVSCSHNQQIMHFQSLLCIIWLALYWRTSSFFSTVLSLLPFLYSSRRWLVVRLNYTAAMMSEKKCVCVYFWVWKGHTVEFLS